MRRKRNLHGGALTTEVTTDKRRLDDDTLRRQIENARQFSAQQKRGFVRSPDVQHAVRVKLGDAGLRFQVALVLHRGGETVFDDDVRGGEAGVNVALVQAGIGAQVGQRMCLWRCTKVLLETRMKDSGG